jgi:hypothetical protein
MLFELPTVVLTLLTVRPPMVMEPITITLLIRSEPSARPSVSDPASTASPRATRASATGEVTDIEVGPVPRFRL